MENRIEWETNLGSAIDRAQGDDVMAADALISEPPFHMGSMDWQENEEIGTWKT